MSDDIFLVIDLCSCFNVVFSHRGANP